MAKILQASKTSSCWDEFRLPPQVTWFSIIWHTFSGDQHNLVLSISSSCNLILTSLVMMSNSLCSFSVSLAISHSSAGISMSSGQASTSSRTTSVRSWDSWVSEIFANSRPTSFLSISFGHCVVSSLLSYLCFRRVRRIETGHVITKILHELAEFVVWFFQVVSVAFL